MAGIGFELRKVMGKGGLFSLFQAALSGVMIVAGPWLLSIASITLINQLMTRIPGADPQVFMGTVVYSYAFSLSLFGGLQYIFTRIIADKLYEKKEDDAASLLIVFLIIITLLSALLSIPAVRGLTVETSYPFLLKVSAVLLFVFINWIWFLMLFISLLRQFIKILLIYLLGMGSAVVLVYLLGNRYSLAGSVLGFALGHLVIAGSLLVLSLSVYRVSRPFSHTGTIWIYMKKFLPLFLIGVFFSLGIWIDKMVYWVLRGTQIPGTFYRLNESYDVTVYFANLTIIPGLVYFIVVSETTFYVKLKKFLLSLFRNRYAVIQKRKYEMIGTMRKSLRDQILFQGVFTIALLLLSPLFFPGYQDVDGFAVTLRLTLLAVFTHLMFLTLLNFLFYMEMYRPATIASLVFLLSNFGISMLDGIPGLSVLPGVSYLISTSAASAVAGYALFQSSKVLDRRLLARSVTT